MFKNWLTASKRICMYLNVHKCVLTGLNGSSEVQTHPNFEKPAKSSQKLQKKSNSSVDIYREPLLPHEMMCLLLAVRCYLYRPAVWTANCGSQSLSNNKLSTKTCKCQRGAARNPLKNMMKPQKWFVKKTCWKESKLVT